jgi:peroxiredoxin
MSQSARYRYNEGVTLSLRASAATVLAAVLFLSGCTKVENKSNVKLDANRKPAPEFSLKDSDGRTVTLADYKGKVVLLNFWATWCGPCKVEIPWFVEFEQKYKDRGFAVLGVALDEEGWEVVKPYINEAKVNYRIIMGNDSIAQLYGGVDNLPTSFILDQNGRIASTHIGLVDKSNYENEISELLKNSQRSDAGSPVLAARRAAD